MARNKHPEETVRLILDAAAMLFAQKGYDKTSLQDIIAATHLSKGAIYYHFVSKEDIFIKICDRIGEENSQILRKVRDSSQLNGREKLRQIFRLSLLSDYQEQMLQMIPYLLDNPKFLAVLMQNLYEEVVPLYMQPILEEGIADGSIQVNHPKEMAEAVMTLSNIWLHPLLRPSAPQEIRARCQVFNELTAWVGVPLLDDEMIDAMVSYSELLEKHQGQ